MGRRLIVAGGAEPGRAPLRAALEADGHTVTEVDPSAAAAALEATDEAYLVGTAGATAVLRACFARAVPAVVVLSGDEVPTDGLREVAAARAERVLVTSGAGVRRLIADGWDAALVAHAPWAADAAEQPVRVRWTGDQHRTSSLALVNRAICDRLAERSDTDLERRATDGPQASSPLTAPDVEVRHAWPPDFGPTDAARLALVQPWEFGSILRSWQGPMTSLVDEVWVPSEYVRGMYLEAGLDGDRVHVVPNGVDLDRFRPRPGPRPDGAVRLLFVGGTIHRKGVDVLVAAYVRAFAGRDDVELVVKDMGGASFYRGMTAGEGLAELAASGRLPRVTYLTDDLSDEAVADLFRSADALVHPYRGEGFAMPVLEAMACGLPVVVTAGGPTDEFCPDEACRRVRSVRRPVAPEALGAPTVGPPWMLEPDEEHLVEVLRELVADPDDRARRGRAARRAAEALSWDAVAERYAERLHRVAERPPRPAAGEPFALPDPAERNLLATPAWRGRDDLARLLAAWSEGFAAGSAVALYLLVHPDTDGAPEDWSRHVLDAAAQADVDLAELADIAVLDHADAGDDLRRLHAAVDGYVPLHAACAGHARLARAAGRPVLDPTAGALRAWAAPIPVQGRGAPDR